MNKAFIFDMDGVLLDSERIWVGENFDFLVGLFGKHIAERIGDTMGVGVYEIYDEAVRYGASFEKQTYLEKYNEKAASILARAPLTEGTERLVDILVSRKFKLGLVSASRLGWIEKVLARLSFGKKFDVVLSVNDEWLPSKPAPDGYIEALRRLEADPRSSIILEDSNRGIQSGKAAGCYVIGFRGNLVAGHEQTGADAYADTMNDVAKLVGSFIQR